MSPPLQRLFDALEADRHWLLEKVNRLPAEQLNQSPPGKWSVNQILAHLIAAERISLLYMNKKILGIEQAGNTGLWEEFKMVLVLISQRVPFKFKAPKVVIDHTESYPDLEQLNAAWDKERLKLRQFLELIQDAQTKKKIYRHVVAGRLNVCHALIFFREHLIHHLPQVRRLL